MLVSLKLLKADFPRTDSRWLNFYSKFVVSDDSEVGPAAKNGRFELTPALIALISLSQGTNDVKAKAICELFSGKRFLKPAPIGIKATNQSLLQERRSLSFGYIEARSSTDEFAKKTYLTKD